MWRGSSLIILATIALAASADERPLIVFTGCAYPPQQKVVFNQNLGSLIAKGHSYTAIGKLKEMELDSINHRRNPTGNETMIIEDEHGIQIEVEIVMDQGKRKVPHHLAGNPECDDHRDGENELNEALRRISNQPTRAGQISGSQTSRVVFGGRKPADGAYRLESGQARVTPVDPTLSSLFGRVRDALTTDSVH